MIRDHNLVHICLSQKKTTVIVFSLLLVIKRSLQTLVSYRRINVAFR